MKFSLERMEHVIVSDAVSRQRVNGEKLEFIAYTYQPGATFAVHHHESEQITVVLEGELVFEFPDEEVHLSSGEGIIIPGDRPHGAYVPESAGETRTFNIFTPVRAEPPTA